MTKKQKTCLFLSGCFILLFSGVTFSDEAKAEKKVKPADKAQTEEMPKLQPKPVFPWDDKNYSMQIIRPKPGVDNQIVKNNFDPNIDYKLRIIDPYTKREITGSERSCFGSFRHKFIREGKKYETPGSDSEK